MSNETFPSSDVTNCITPSLVVRIKNDAIGPCNVLIEVAVWPGSTTYAQARDALRAAVRQAERQIDSVFQ